MIVRGSVEVNPADLILTNQDINLDVVREMVNGLLAHTIQPEDLTIPYITFVEGTGWCVNDGNHTVEALKLAGILSVRADFY